MDPTCSLMSIFEMLWARWGFDVVDLRGCLGAVVTPRTLNELIESSVLASVKSSSILARLSLAIDSQKIIANFSLRIVTCSLDAIFFSEKASFLGCIPIEWANPIRYWLVFLAFLLFLKRSLVSSLYWLNMMFNWCLLCYLWSTWWILIFVIL